MSSKRRRPARAALLGALLAGGVVGVPGTPIPSAAAPAAGQAAHAVVVDQAGVAIGHVELADEGGRTRVHVEVSGLTPGFHGFHVHAGTACTGDFVASAMGHHNPEAGGHGSHDGDMPVLFADAEGRARTSFVTDHFTVDAVLGRAVIVHAGRDNLANIPDRYHSDTPDAPAAGPDQATLDTGDSGARVGCGTIAAAGGTTEDGYWLAGADGGVFAFGDAGFHGSMGGKRIAAPVVGMAPTPGGGGYWLVGSDGGVFAFGDAGFHGSMGGKRIAAPVVGMAPTPTGRGYWLVASDGGVFAFGDARFAGSTGARRLAAPVVDLAATPTGGGYWLLGADGGIFAFGDADFRGSGAGTRRGAAATDIVASHR